MWKILVLAPVLFILSNSEVISKRKTIPLSKQTCPCWWDLEGTQIDPNTNEPYKCACCKSGKKICNYFLIIAWLITYFGNFVFVFLTLRLSDFRYDVLYLQGKMDKKL